MRYILGINSAYHESSACLLKDGVIVGAVEEERLSRVKHAKKASVDNPDELPLRAIRIVDRHRVGTTPTGFAAKPATRQYIARDLAADLVSLFASGAQVPAGLPSGSPAGIRLQLRTRSADGENA